MIQAIAAPERVAPTVAQQIFVIGSAIGAITAGIFLAKGLSQVRDVPTSRVVGATIISGLFTFLGGAYLARTSK